MSFAFATLFYIYEGYSIPIKEILRIITPVPSPVFGAPILLQGWTLYFEIAFYTLVTITIALNSKKYLLLTSLMLSVFVLLNYATDRLGFPLPFPGNGLMLEFLMGVIAGRLYLSKASVSKGLAIFILSAGIIGLVSTLIMGYGNMSEMGEVFNGSQSLERCLLWGIPCAFVVTGLTALEKNRPLKLPGVLAAIGNASFSIYLIQLLLLDYEYKFWTVSGIDKIASADILLLLSITATLFVGWLFYKLVEVPLLYQLNKLIDTPKIKALIKRPL